MAAGPVRVCTVGSIAVTGGGHVGHEHILWHGRQGDKADECVRFT